MVARQVPARVNKDNVKITTQAVAMKAPHSAKSLQAWKYAGNQIVRAPSVLIGSRIYYDPKHPSEKLARRRQQSNFFLTINTNLEPDCEGMVVQQLKAAIAHLKTDAILATCLKFGPKDPILPEETMKDPKNLYTYRNDRYADVIDKVEWRDAIEVGPVHNRVHCHIWVTIDHYSQIQFNTHMLMTLTKRVFNASGPMRMSRMPYVHIKLLPQSDWTDIMKQYIHKAWST